MNVLKCFIPKVTLVALCVSSLTFAQENQLPMSLVQVEPVRSESISQYVLMPGTVVSRVDASLASETAGRIEWLAEVGEIVAPGDVLAKLDDTRLTLRKQQHQMAIENWLTRVELLERKVKRFEKMVALKNVSKDQLDDVTIELEMAKQQLTQERYEMELTQHQIDQSLVKAPFTAMVVERLQSPGEYTSVGQTLMRIVDVQNIEVTVRAPLTALPYLSKGSIVNVELGENQTRRPIRAIVPVGDEQSRLMEVRVSLEPSTFAIGSAVKVALPNSSPHEGVTVPRDALVLRKAGTFIFQIDEDNNAVRIPVKTGVGQYDRIEVFGDVEQTRPVVTRGAERLREGQKVRFSTENQTLTASIVGVGR